MKRKYMSEFALNTFSSYLTICYPNDLDALNPKINYHIYMITLIPRLTFERDSLQIFEDHILLKIRVKTEEQDTIETFEFGLEPDLNHKDLIYEIDKASKTLSIVTKEEKIFKIRVLNLYLNYTDQFLETEIVYIGQSFGKNGERTALDRLKSHSTLQKIQSDLLFEREDRDLTLLLLEFTPMLLSSFDGRSKDYERSLDDDTIHLKSIMENPPLRLNNQIINITEAALIYYFKPEYNDKFKNNFPDVEHKGYKQYYDLDYNAICVELDPEAINLKLYSKERRYYPFRSIRYSLHPDNIRKSMFDIFS
ncbi:hypothetical protein [Bacillus sonorensis]|uniref:hypothetical protein n=1 Tax=Bacillus sonorensis TaxID=119858 RepID=UPI00227DD119|nr:hypothetical protein [Bacillus sonorensis]MCY8272963.1 hypothetical protein [Bacillus sonorensis]MCY8605232.1 hypothetical protein [Bacillus sonorensis]